MIKNTLIKERNRINSICEAIKNEQKEKKYENLPTLKVSRCHGTYQYHSGKHYISRKKTDYLENLAKKEYYDTLLPELELYLEKCDELLGLLEAGAPDTPFHKLSEGKRMLLKDVLYRPVSEQVREFMETTFDKSGMTYEIETEIYTNKGEQVRSKSEKIIADEMYRRGIPYHYEKPLNLDDRGRNVVLHPDFTAINVRTGRIIFLEHLGLMDRPEYCQNVVRKLNLYERNGLLLGRDILLFHESSSEPLNNLILNQYLDEYLE